MDSDAADPNWWTSSPKRPREEDDEVAKFPLRQDVNPSDLEFSSEVAAFMAHHPSTEISQLKKKKKIAADHLVYLEEVTTSSSSNNSNNGIVPNVPIDEITRVLDDVTFQESPELLVAQHRLHHSPRLYGHIFVVIPANLYVVSTLACLHGFREQFHLRFICDHSISFRLVRCS